MTLVPTLIELAFLGYAQSGMPGLGAVEPLFSLLKSYITPTRQNKTSENATTTTTTIEPNQTQNSEEFRNPVNVNNDNVEKASVNIEINQHQHHHHYHDDQEALSDGGEKRDNENKR